MHALIANTASVAETAKIGIKNRDLIQGTRPQEGFTKIGDNVFIGEYVVIGAGCLVGGQTFIQPHCIVESDVIIGAGCVLMNRAILQSGVRIGNNCIIASIIGENANVSDNCRIFGTIGHSHRDPSCPWDADDSREPAPDVRERSFVGLGAVVTGGISIGPQSYVCAGAIVSKNVPPKHICSGVNRIVPYHEWRGPLSLSPFFEA